jgi:penicillin-binding protein 2
VILENAGEGSDFAAPIFRAIVESYFYGSWQGHPWYAANYGEPTYTPTPFGANPSKTPKPPKGKKGAATPTP